MPLPRCTRRYRERWGIYSPPFAGGLMREPRESSAWKGSAGPATWYPCPGTVSWRLHWQPLTLLSPPCCWGWGYVNPESSPHCSSLHQAPLLPVGLPPALTTLLCELPVHPRGHLGFWLPAAPDLAPPHPTLHDSGVIGKPPQHPSDHSRGPCDPVGLGWHLPHRQPAALVHGHTSRDTARCAVDFNSLASKHSKLRRHALSLRTPKGSTRRIPIPRSPLHSYSVSQ